MASGGAEQSVESELIKQAGQTADKFIESRKGAVDIAEKLVDRLPVDGLFWLAVLVIVSFLFYKVLPHILDHSRRTLALSREWDHKDKALQAKLAEADERRKRRREKAEAKQAGAPR